MCGIPHTSSHIICDCQGVKLPRNIVGPVIRELREKQGLTQSAFVAKLNLLGWDVSRDIIARIEGQVRWVADFEIVKLAAGLGMEYTELLKRSVVKSEKYPSTQPALLRKN